MADNRTISQLEAEGYPWIGCECCKGTARVPFRMIRERTGVPKGVDQWGWSCGFHPGSDVKDHARYGRDVDQARADFEAAWRLHRHRLDAMAAKKGPPV
jgi:hypothetical protein